MVFPAAPSHSFSMAQNWVSRWGGLKPPPLCLLPHHLLPDLFFLVTPRCFPWVPQTEPFGSGLPFLSPGDLPDPGIKTGSPTLQADSLPSEPPENPSDRATGPQSSVSYEQVTTELVEAKIPAHRGECLKRMGVEDSRGLRKLSVLL